MMKCRNIIGGKNILYRLCVYNGRDFSVVGYNQRTGNILVELSVEAGAMGKAKVVRAYTMPSLLRQRIGTPAYEIAAQEACRQGRRLTSDDVRSPFAEAFWRKQAKKGRAVCLTKGEAGGNVWRSDSLPIPASLPQPKTIRGKRDRWPCLWWGMKPSVCTSPSGVSLSGLKRGR